MTQEAFGTAGGVLKRAVINYEKGERAPDVTFLAGIANAGADVLYIVTGARAPQGGQLSPAEAALLDSYAQADDAGRAVLQGVAELAKRTAGAKPAGKGNSITIGGDVGQAVAGDQNNAAPVSFSVGGKRK